MPHDAAHFGVPVSAAAADHAVHPACRYTADDERGEEGSGSHRIPDGVRVLKWDVTDSEYGVYYESNNATGVLQIALKPDLVALVSYPELPSPFLKVVAILLR